MNLPQRGRSRAASSLAQRLPLPPLSFPDALPVSASRERIARAIREHSVVIVCGETGSGKTTQLPKICALAGRGQAGLIGHTQPRRIAATTVANRIAQELGSPPGMHVGYKIRFNENVSAGATIKLMTDGVLLAETQSDPLLSQYDTLIIDEAHERSLNIDFLLGYLRQLVQGPRRDSLKLVITSATIDADRFARHFAQSTGAGSEPVPAPVIEVSGRLYPVEIRYQGFDDAHRDDDDETDLPSRIDEAIESLWREAPGDALVFLPGEREIREVADHLRRLVARESAARSGSPWSRGSVEILPLFSRLSAAEQARIFSPGSARRIVLATNVAETSITVPGIRYVVDTGLARVKRYRYRGKVEQLQIEPISQAAANQRAGRCGRVADGVCIRLYDESDFLGRPRFTDPEVLRSSLAAVILRMKALRLADIDAFPFLDPPPRRAIVDGFASLHELGAVDERHQLTRIGVQLSRLPVDPRIGRMLLAAHEYNCLRELLIIAAALSVQDPRERPLEAQQAADQAHRRFADEHSDFLSWVKLWDYWQKAVSERESHRKLAQQLEREFLSVRKLREWADVHAQLTDAIATLNWKPNDNAATYEAVHRALLSGLLGNLGCKPLDEPSYQGTHQVRFTIHPGSALVKKAPRWLMAAEIVDTARIYARTVARVEPQWIEQAAAHLIQRSWGDPVWSKASGHAIAHERGVLYGLNLYTQRRVPLAPRDPKLARELLIREGLMADGIEARLPFLIHNRKLVADIEKLEQQIRRPDLLVDDQFLYDWYDAALPAEVVSLQSLERCLSRIDDAARSRLLLSRESLLRREADGVASDAFPRQMLMRGASFDLEYRFDPGSDDDGLTLTVPLVLLNQVDPIRCEWLVPGMLRDKVQSLMKSLPQRLRRHLVPLPEQAQAFVARWSDRMGERPLIAALIDDMAQTHGVRAQATDFRIETVPPHLLMNFRLLGEHGVRLGMGRNLAQIKAEHGDRAQGAFRQALSSLGIAATLPGQVSERSGSIARDESAAAGTPGVGATGLAGAAGAAAGAGAGASGGIRAAAGAVAAGAQAARPGLVRAGQRYTDWQFATLPELMELEQRIDGRMQILIGYPALIDKLDSVELAVFDEPERAVREHRAGLIRLFVLALREPLKFFERNIADFQRLALQFASFGSGEDLRRDLTAALIERACLADPLPCDADSFKSRVQEARPRLSLIGQELVRTVSEILNEHAQLQRKWPALRAHPAALTDIETQLQGLLGKRFIAMTPWAQLRHLPRYVKAVAMRIDKLRGDSVRDARLQAEMAPLVLNLRRLLQQRRGLDDARLEEFRWMLEELRVSLFAQTLRTPMPVSVKRLQKAWDALRA